MYKRGSLYGNFVSANDGVENKAYRGAEIPPPPNLGTSGRTVMPKIGGVIAKLGPGSTPVVNKQGYTTSQSINDASLQYSQYGIAIKRARTEEEYFNSDEEEEQPEYQPKAGSPGPGNQNVESDEEDELDVYMKSLEKDVQKKGAGGAGGSTSKSVSTSSDSKLHGKDGRKILKTGMIVKKPIQDISKGIRDDIDGEDDEESYYRWLAENPNAGRTGDEDDGPHIDYDADGNPLVPDKDKHIDPLALIDHSTIKYHSFEKNFYEEHGDISSLSNIQAIDLQQKLNVKVSGPSPPRPVTSFAHFGFDDQLLKSIRKSEFSQPTSIQSVGIPGLLSGRDVIGIAQTGSGKTAAFLWPMLVHIMDQPELSKGEGPIALILVPTRELALQIYTETRKYSKVYNITSVCAYGGGNKYEQSKAFEAGAEIAIATPGRMIDMIKMKVTNLERVTYLVLDEADRMFDMGFEPQVRSLCDHVRPDRQCSLFSATFKKKIEKLARDVLTDPVKIVQGDVGVASENVTQIVKVVPLGGHKWQWLTKNLVQFMSRGSVLVFVTKKQNCEELSHNLKIKAEIDCRCLQGDMFQTERNDIISKFKKQEFPVLVATDVAARGLDIPHIRTVINFDVARDIDTHTHRIGRTGRAGIKGEAYTLVTSNDKEFAGHIVRNLEAANQDVPKDLMDLAMQSSWFKNSRFQRGRGKGAGGAGLGYRDRPAIGYDPSSNEDSTSIATQYAFDKKRKEGLARASSGGGTDRLGAVKQAYKNQFMSNFRAAESSEAGYNPNSRLIEEKKPRKRPSRWSDE